MTDKTYTCLPNPHYCVKARIKSDKIVLSVFEFQNSAVQAMKAGQLKLLVSDPVTGHAYPKPVLEAGRRDDISIPSPAGAGAIAGGCGGSAISHPPPR